MPPRPLNYCKIYPLFIINRCLGITDRGIAALAHNFRTNLVGLQHLNLDFGLLCMINIYSIFDLDINNHPFDLTYYN